MIKIFRVSGGSMSPALNHGDYVLASRWFLKPEAGRLVVVRHGKLGIIVKRIAEKTSQGFWLKSDNALGSSTSSMGMISYGQLMGTVFFIIRKNKTTPS
ncbi:MAG: peptidase S24 [Deltaproteobacteria bacterium]|nr:MAG: peptidase S24 [Deltaproteobacteria bacterium]